MARPTAAHVAACSTKGPVAKPSSIPCSTFAQMAKAPHHSARDRKPRRPLRYRSHPRTSSTDPRRPPYWIPRPMARSAARSLGERTRRNSRSRDVCCKRDTARPTARTRWPGGRRGPRCRCRGRCTRLEGPVRPGPPPDSPPGARGPGPGRGSPRTFRLRRRRGPVAWMSCGRESAGVLRASGARCIAVECLAPAGQIKFSARSCTSRGPADPALSHCSTWRAALLCSGPLSRSHP